VGDPGASADRIHVEQLELYTRVGVTENERSAPQRITVNLTAWPRPDFDDLDDNLTRTVNYAELCREIRNLVENRSVSLIETLVSEIITRLLTQFPLRAVEIELRKYVLPDTKYVAVIARREAGHDK